jgi:3-hydroxybutyryl-CoA dehydrogenase
MSALDTSVVVAVIGAGAMGAGIAQVAAQAGHPVLLHDSRPGAASAAIEGLGVQLGKRVEKGKLDPAQREATLARGAPRGGRGPPGRAAPGCGRSTSWRTLGW